MAKNLFFVFSIIVLNFEICYSQISSTIDVDIRFRPFKVGWMNAYRMIGANGKPQDVTIAFPLEPGGQSKIINMGSLGVTGYSYLPKKMLISDGSLFSKFRYINRTQGSLTDLVVEKIKKDILLHYRTSELRISSDQVKIFLAEKINNYIEWKKPEFIFPWDITLNPNQLKVEAFEGLVSALNQSELGSYIIRSETHPIVNFDNYLNARTGHCMEMALLASFVLESFNIKHRLVFGANTDLNFKGNGHTWIKFPDETTLDVAWKTYRPISVQKNIPGKPGWFKYTNAFGSTYRYEYQHFLFLVLDQNYDWNDQLHAPVSTP